MIFRPVAYNLSKLCQTGMLLTPFPIMVQGLFLTYSDNTGPDMTQMNPAKYSAYPPVNLADRSWPNKLITTAPIWCSVDLRDGIKP